MTAESKLRDAALRAIDRFCEREGFPVPPLQEIVTEPANLKRRVDFIGKSPDGREFSIGYELKVQP